MVPLINNAGRTLRWFFEDVWGHFDADHAAHGAPLFPSERKNVDGTARRVGDDALRAGLAEATHRPSAGLVRHAHPARAAALLR
jgi:integrase/recombinase XerD